MPPQIRRPGRKGNTRPDRVRNASPSTTCKCDECLETYPDGRTLSRRQAERHAQEKADQFAREQEGDAGLAYAVAQSMANGEEPNNSDFEPGGNDDVVEGEGDDGAWSDVDELGDLSMVELMTSDEESDTDLDVDEEESDEDGGFGAMGPSWAMGGPEPAPFMDQAAGEAAAGGGEAAAGGNDQAGLPGPGLAPQAPNLRPAPRSRPRLS